MTSTGTDNAVGPHPTMNIPAKSMIAVRTLGSSRKSLMSAMGGDTSAGQNYDVLDIEHGR
jgi:hypothetical protein